MQDYTTSIPDLLGTVRLDSMQLNCCRLMTLDTGYNPGTANSLGSRLNKSKLGPTVKPRSG
jgi:hypothetical protein